METKQFGILEITTTIHLQTKKAPDINPKTRPYLDVDFPMNTRITLHPTVAQGHYHIFQ